MRCKILVDKLMINKLILGCKTKGGMLVRSVKGYCMRQARREVYKAFRKVDWNKPTTNNTKVEYSTNDVLIGFGMLFGLFFFIGWLMS
jgi:hypothetical protein